jgi:hypothetical protein
MRLLALTATVPLPEGTTTVAEVEVVLTTCAERPPKEKVAFSRPNPPMVASTPGAACEGETDVTSGHDQPPAIGVPRPVTGS